MRMNRGVDVLWGVTGIALLACGAPMSGPVAPRSSSNVTLSLAAMQSMGANDGESPIAAGIAAIVPGGGKASGHADVHATPTQNIRDESYSFTAVSTDVYPTARGQFEAHALRFTGEAVAIHAEVTCMSVVGNRAFIGARITRATLDGEEVPNSSGSALVFTVQDLGNAEGGPDGDMASLFFLPGTTGGDLAYCNSRPVIPILRPTTIGNVEVKQK
jgi:hypothetical protein